MERRLNKEDFFSLFGLKPALANLKNQKKSTHTVISTDLESGAIRAQLFKAEKTQDGYEIKLEYLFHQNPAGSDVVTFLKTKVKEVGGEIILENAWLDGKKLNLKNGETVFALSKAYKRFSDNIIRNNEWANPVSLMRDCGLMQGVIGQRAWPGLYVTGDRRSLPAVRKPQTGSGDNKYPVSFLASIMGVGPDHQEGKKEASQSLILTADNTQDSSFSLKYKMTRGKTDRDLHVIGTISKYNNQEKKDEVLYEVRSEAVKNNSDYGEITELRYLGQPIDLSDQMAVINILKNIRNLNRTIRAGDQALIDDLKKNPYERRYALPGEMMLYMDTHQYLNENVPVPDEGIMTFSAVGGNNNRKYVSDYDQHIGGNQYVISHHTKNEAGEVNSEALMVDSGVQFHDVFNIVFYNPSRYLHHKQDKDHTPKEDLKAIFITHPHQDHLGQMCYLAKCGYELPALIMNKMAVAQLNADMQALDVDRAIRDEILAKCYVIDFMQDIDPDNPGQRKVTRVANTDIEQWTEEIPLDETTGDAAYYPRLKIGGMEVRVGPMPHSSPGLMLDVITSAGTHRHTGDFKMDDTILLPMPPLKPWLEAVKPDSLSIDSTGITRKGYTPKEADVRASISKVIQENEGRRFIFPMLGSNLARLTSLIAALGQTDTKKLVVDGHSVERMVRSANKVHNLRKWAKDEYGVDVLVRNYKEANRLLKEGEEGEYAILVTGTQDEYLSTMNRAARDWLPSDRFSINKNDVIIPLQGTIPVGQNYTRRKGLAYVINDFFGATFMLPEEVKREADYIFEASGHASQLDIRDMIKYSGVPHVIPMHGGPDQLKANAEFAKTLGAETTILSGSVAARIEKGKKVSAFRHFPTEFVGIRPHTLAREKFYLKGHFSTCVIPVSPPANSQAKKLVEKFENSVRDQAGINNKLEVAKSLPVSLSKYFNVVAGNGYLKQDMPFGIDKRSSGNIFEDKNIFAIGAFDTETGGLNANDYLVREFGMTVEDLNRNILEEVELIQKIPEYRLPNPAAMLVTNTAPKDLKKGVPAHIFIQRVNQAITGLKDHSHAVGSKNGKISDKRTAKAISLAHNMRFDSRFIQKEEARNLHAASRPHETRGIIALDTRAISRALYAYCPGKYNVDVNPATGFPDHTLKGLCDANGLPYDDDAGHSALYDTKPLLDLFWKQHEIAPDLVAQMVMNADGTRNHLLHDMMGMETGFGGPQPVFSYVSQMASRPKAQIGCCIGALDTKRHAIIFNLKYDPEKYLPLPTKKILEMLQDPDNDVFELMDLRQQPIIVPARFGFRIKANGNIPKELIDRRAGAVRRHLNYIDPKSDWQTIDQKIELASVEEKKKIFAARRPDGNPNSERGLWQKREKGPTPESGLLTLARMQAKIGFNPIYKTVQAKIRAYHAAVDANHLDQASEIYKKLMEDRTHLGKARYTINNVHYDICPKDLSAADKKEIELVRHNMFSRLHKIAAEEIEAIETNRNGKYDQLIGTDPQKQALFDNLKTWYQSLAKKAALTPEGRSLIRPWRKYTRADNDNNSFKANDNKGPKDKGPNLNFG